MLESLITHLNGLLRSDLLRLLKGLFLVFLTLAVLAILFAPAVKPGKVRYRLLRILIGGALFAMLVYQSTWQITGYMRPEFVKFLRRYNRRPQAAEIQVMRGPLLDCRGMVLAAPITGDVWGRRYPLGEAAVHPLGYFHSRFGITAVERVCDPELSGYVADKRMMLSGKAFFTARAEEGAAVTLNLDARLQRLAYRLMAGRKGAVVIMEPQSGALLALVSSPGFNPLDPGPATLDERNMPVFNRAIQGRYPPGSVFKILIAGMALEEKRTPTYFCPAEGYLAAAHTPPIRDSEYYACMRKGTVWSGWGRMNIEEALVHSSNVYFAQLGVGCGTRAFNDIILRSHINKSLTYLKGVSGVLKSSSGEVPQVTRPSQLALLSIGQGEVLTTPLHVACLTAAVAAGGNLMRPRLLKEDSIDRLETLFSSATASRLSGMMRQVVRAGTGKGADVAGLEVCGKTGTAQVTGGEDHAWFTCFAPQRNPRIVVTVLIERGGFGARTALPVARALLVEADRLGYVRGTRRGAQ